MLQTNEKINLREERDFGSKLNTTFHFIRANFRPLLRTLLFYVTPVALVSGLFSGLHQARLLQTITGNRVYQTYGDYSFFNQVTSVSYYFTMFFTLVSIFVLYLAVYSFMVVYQDEEGEVQPSLVWQVMKMNLVKVIYSGVALSVITFLSVFMLGFGIYFAIVVSIFVMVMVREETGFIETIERCFYLIKGHWWATFGLLLVAGSIQGVIGLLAGLPTGIITVLRIFEIPGVESDLPLIVAGSLTSVLTVYIYAISAIAIGFQYFNLVEIKDGIGLMEQAELIGRSDRDTTANEGHF